MRTDEELRTSGWAEEDIRGYRRGIEEAHRQFSAAALPAAWPEPPAVPRYLPGEPFRFAGNSDRAAWTRTTIAGRLSLLSARADDAAQLAEAKDLADRREMTYGSRPPLAQCLAKVRQDGPRGTVLSGPAEEVGSAFRTAGLPFAVVHEMLPPTAVVHEMPALRAIRPAG